VVRASVSLAHLYDDAVLSLLFPELVVRWWSLKPHISFTRLTGSKQHLPSKNPLASVTAIAAATRSLRVSKERALDFPFICVLRRSQWPSVLATSAEKCCITPRTV
jgi:hypothetical protein